jgi:hypothetical protein
MVLLLVSISLHAVPAYIEKELCKELAYDDVTCASNGAEILKYRHLLLNNDKILIFFYLESNKPMYRGYFKTLPKVSVIIDKYGKWYVSKNNQSGYIERITEDFRHHIWLKSSLEMESPYPLLRYSENGKKWWDIDFPLEENKGYYEYKIGKLCFEQNHLILELISGEEKNFWRVDYLSMLSRNPKWKLHSGTLKKCIKSSKAKNSWKVVEKNGKITFQRSKVKIRVPVTSQLPHYVIQLGAFKERRNFNFVSSKIGKLITYSDLHDSESKEYIRLFKGLFTNKKRAEIALKVLKKKYTNDKDIQQAFVKKIKEER